MDNYNQESARALALELGIDIVEDPSRSPLVKDQIKIIPYKFAKSNLVLPIVDNGGVLTVATATPCDFDLFKSIEFITGRELVEVFSPREALMQAIELCYKQNNDEISSFIKNLDVGSQLTSAGEHYDLLDRNDGSPAIRILDMILAEGISQEASDIHFEPRGDGTIAVRYRVDGMLQFGHSIPHDISAKITSRLKILSKMDISEKRLPQDGRIKLSIGERQIDFRVSSIPVKGGERTVLRILETGKVFRCINDLQMSPNAFEGFSHAIHQSYGIVLVTGPTGSGKTTTLYSALREISSDCFNIITIEDPVEYTLSSISQIGVNHKIGLTFAKGLRSILRQDPDVIMVGEIRDPETAEIAIQAALTGHLVLTTLHTNDAPSAIVRLVDMGIEPYLLSSSIIGVLAQRLVRCLCNHCKSPVSAGEVVGSVGSDVTTYDPTGCKECFWSGYKYRRALFEFMPLTRKIRNEIMVNSDAGRLRDIAVNGGMSTLWEAGIDMVKSGDTSFSEIIRITKSLEFV